MTRTALLTIALLAPGLAAAQDFPLVEDYAPPVIEVELLDEALPPMEDLLGPAPAPAGSFTLVAVPEPPPPPAPAGSFTLVAVPEPPTVAPEPVVVLEVEVEEQQGVREALHEVVEDVREVGHTARVEIRERRLALVAPAPPPPPPVPPVVVPEPPPPPPVVVEEEARVPRERRHPFFADMHVGSTLIAHTPQSTLDLSMGWYLRKHLALGFYVGWSTPVRPFQDEPVISARTGIAPSLVFGRGRLIRTHADLLLGWGASADLDGNGPSALYSFAVPRVGADLRLAKNLYVGGTVGTRVLPGSIDVQEIWGGPEVGLLIRLGK